MIKTKFVPTNPYRVVIYARMSSDKQNPRSPDQQIATIQELIRRDNLPWEVLAVYRDDGISGRFTRKRPGYQKMLRELKSGAVQAQLLLVDTFERLSRAKDSAEVRKQLRKFGVLVLTANSRFQDPTSVAGRALGMFDSYRATAEGEIKAHNVVRGKKDAVHLGHWAGGPVPFGFRLKTIMKVERGVENVDYRILEPIPELVWIVELIFSLAAEQAWGGGRISRALNEHPEIPAEFKPFQCTTIDYMLRNRVYCGEYVWGKNSTDIEDDIRILEANPEEEWAVNSEFCEAIIPKETWDKVEQLRLARQRTPDPGNGCELEIPGLRSSGIALKYPLSGFVVCEMCGRTMTVSSGAPYTTTSGEQRSYPSYVCPGARSNACSNHCHVPEPWLRETVVNLARQRLFLTDGPPETSAAADGIDSRSEVGARAVSIPDKQRIMQSDALQAFVGEVRLRFEAAQPNKQAVLSRLRSERGSLEERCRGWRMSLGDPDISQSIRIDIQKDYTHAKQRISEIDRQLRETQTLSSSAEELVNLDSVAERLERLSSLLDGENASAINIALAQHIESIRCDPDGKVRLRMCTLGALANPLEIAGVAGLLPPAAADPLSQPTANPRRRRTRRDVGEASGDFEDLDLANDMAVTVDRFEGLGDEWFTVDDFQIERHKSWALSMARAVAEYRLNTGATMGKTAEHFARTIPTIRAALRYAEKEYGLCAQGKTLSQDTWATWSRLNAHQVAAFLAQPGATRESAAQHFGKSLPTIEAARRLATETQPPETNATGSD